MASPIEKKTSRIKLVLEERVPGLKQEARIKKQELMKDESAPETAEIKPEKISNKVAAERKPEIKKEIGKKGGVLGRVSGLGRKFFRRKAI